MTGPPAPPPQDLQSGSGTSVPRRSPQRCIPWWASIVIIEGRTCAGELPSAPHGGGHDRSMVPLKGLCFVVHGRWPWPIRRRGRGRGSRRRTAGRSWRPGSPPRQGPAARRRWRDRGRSPRTPGTRAGTAGHRASRPVRAPRPHGWRTRPRPRPHVALAARAATLPADLARSRRQVFPSPGSRTGGSMRAGTSMSSGRKSGTGIPRPVCH